MRDIKIIADTYTRTSSNGTYTGWGRVRTVLHSSSSMIAQLINPSGIAEMDEPGKLTFTMLPSNPGYNVIKARRSEISVWIGSTIIWCGFVKNITEDFYLQRQVTCEGALGYAKDSILPTDKHFRSGENAMYELLFGSQVGNVGDENYSGKGFITQHNLMMGDCRWKCFRVLSASAVMHSGIGDNATSFEKNIECYTKNETLFDAIKERLSEREGMHINLIYSDSSSGIVKTPVLYSGEDAFQNSGNTKTISYGKHILDIIKNLNTDKLITALFPLGATCEGNWDDAQERLKIGTANNGCDYIENEDAVTQYGRIFSTEVFDEYTNISQAPQLKKSGDKFLKSKALSTDELEITAAQFYTLTGSQAPTKIGDVLRIFSNAHGIDTYLPCKKIAFNFSSPDQNKLYFGKSKKTLTSELLKTIRAQKYNKYSK